MKLRYLSALVITLISFQAHAAVVDKFKCETKFTSTDILYPSITNQFEFNMVRIPAEENELYTSTKAESYQIVEIQTARKDKYLIKMDYNYIHALKKVNDGEATDARLATCVNVIVYANGAPSDFSCPKITPNPFDESNNRWLKVSVKDGIPNIPRLWKFEVDLLEGNLNISCIRIGTTK
jgi:hypothetical protein